MAVISEAKLASYHFHLHNAATLLARLGRTDAPPDPLAVLQRQARDEANRLRAVFGKVEDRHRRRLHQSTDLQQTLARVVADYPQVPIRLRASLAAGVELPTPILSALTTAVTALLDNAQRHSEAEEVVVYAEAAGGRWEVSVADDGVGFDEHTTPFREGLRVRVLDNAARHGITVTIDSHAGQGTVVSLSGRIRPNQESR
jgi:signal transduction histidine kinase